MVLLDLLPTIATKPQHLFKRKLCYVDDPNGYNDIRISFQKVFQEDDIHFQLIETFQVAH